MLSTLVAVLILVGFMQWLYFPNINKNFEPDMFIYIFGAFGAVIWFLFKSRREISYSAIVKLFFLSRAGILLVQVFFFLVGGYYNRINEVKYYEELADVILNPTSGSLWRTIKYGIPPGYQLWLVVYDVLIFSLPMDIFRDVAFSTYNIAFEFGTLIVLVKMRELREFHTIQKNDEETGKRFFQFGLTFYAVSIFNLYYSNVRSFMDPISIFIAILGLYFYMQKRHVISSLLLSISTLIKFIPIFWLLLIILNLLKKRDYKSAFGYIIPSAGMAGGGVFSSALFFRMDPVAYFFAFLNQFQTWSYKAGANLQLNQAFWFEAYNPAFFLAGLIGIAAFAFFLVWKARNDLTIHSFTSVICIYFVFQPWYDQRYVIWILPLLCVDVLSSRRRFAAIITLFYISIFIYLVFMHVPNNLGIDTSMRSTNPLIGILYRVTGQFTSYAAFLLIPILHVNEILHNRLLSEKNNLESGGTIRS